MEDPLMLTCRCFTTVLASLLFANSLWAQGVALTEAPLAQSCVRNELTLELKGTQTVKQNGKDIIYPVKVLARHEYMERYLDVNGPVSDKAARYYTSADSIIYFNNDEGSKRTLPDIHRFMVAQRINDQIVRFNPNGKQLTREEIDLTDHFDTLAVSGLVPGKVIEVGKSWKIPNHVIAALCDLGGVNAQKVEGTLVSIKGSVAHVQLVGDVQGIDMGAQVSMLINSRLEFDTGVHRITYVEWRQKDDRQQGPISPAMSADVTIKLRRIPIKTPFQLNENALVPIPDAKTPPSHLTSISHQDARKRYTLQYARDWYVTSPEKNPQLVMRLMERGKLIAQVTITPWTKVDPKGVMTKEQFADEMAKTPSWSVEQKDNPEELKPSKSQHKVYRAAASGELDGVKTWQCFYLIVSPQGEQVIMTFATAPQDVQRLGARDLELVRELVVSETAEEPNVSPKLP
jgi:hypothetical protein